MNILITGTGTNNRGAELMLIAIVRHFADHLPRHKLCVPHDCGDYSLRTKHNLYQFLEIKRLGRAKLGVALLPTPLRHSLGILSEPDIDAVIDASGFAFGDQLSLHRLEQFATDVRRWKQQGKKIILLPQAFGPFRNEPHRRAFLDMLPRVDLAYARDESSLSYIREIAPDTPNVCLSPDFTIPLGQAGERNRPTEPKQVLFVPNSRMLDKSDSEVSKTYPKTLAVCIEKVIDFGYSPALLIHDNREDLALVPLVEAHLKTKIPVLHDPCPLKLKEIIGQSALLVGSRFHALVGALSQGVPAIAFGWSHKYQQLFQDFDCEDAVLDVQGSPSDIEDRLHRSLTGPHRTSLIARITAAATRQSTLVSDMWTQVHRQLETQNPN